MDLTSAAAIEVLGLSKTAATKRLQQAVRESQGSKRACWAAAECPAWWLQNHPVQLADDEVVNSLPFTSKAKGNWELDRMRVTLLLFEFRDSLSEVCEATPAKSSLKDAVVSMQSPQLVDGGAFEAEPYQTEADSNLVPSPPVKTPQSRQAVGGEENAAESPEAEPARDPSDIESTPSLHDDEFRDALGDAPEITPEKIARKAGNERTEPPKSDDSGEADESLAHSRTDNDHSSQPMVRVTRSRKDRKKSGGPVESVVAEPKIEPTTVDLSRAARREEHAVISDGEPLGSSSTEGHNLGTTVFDDRGEGSAADDSGSDVTAITSADERIFEEELDAWEAEALEKVMDMERAFETEKLGLRQQYKMFLMSLPRDIREMPVTQYIKECGGNPDVHMIELVAKISKRVGVAGLSEEMSTGRERSVSPTKRARRDDVTATARKTARAARVRQLEDEEAQKTLPTRRMPVRASALRAKDANNAIMQRANHRGRQRREAQTPRNAMMTPAQRRAPATQFRNAWDKREFETTARKIANPRAFIADQRAKQEAEYKARMAELDAIAQQVLKDREAELDEV